jgi:hypothetical protein
VRRARRPAPRLKAALTRIVAEVDIAAVGWVSVAEMVEADRVVVDENTVRGPGRARRRRCRPCDRVGPSAFAEGCVLRLVG